MHDCGTRGYCRVDTQTSDSLAQCCCDGPACNGNVSFTDPSVVSPGFPTLYLFLFTPLSLSTTHKQASSSSLPPTSPLFFPPPFLPPSLFSPLPPSFFPSLPPSLPSLLQLTSVPSSAVSTHALCTMGQQGASVARATLSMALSALVRGAEMGSGVGGGQLENARGSYWWLCVSLSRH